MIRAALAFVLSGLVALTIVASARPDDAADRVRVALALAQAQADATAAPKTVASTPPAARGAGTALTPSPPAPLTRTATHSHRCPFDGTVWTHDDSSYGRIADHRCPTCGRVTWQVYQRFASPARPAAPLPLAFPLACPPGQP